MLKWQDHYTPEEWEERKKRNNAMQFQPVPLTESQKITKSQKKLQEELIALDEKTQKAILEDDSEWGETARNLRDDKITREEYDKIIDRLWRELMEEEGLAHNFSNGPIEGMNNLIKAIKRTAYGYRCFSNFRKRILVIRGDILISSNF